MSQDHLEAGILWLPHIFQKCFLSRNEHLGLKISHQARLFDHFCSWEGFICFQPSLQVGRSLASSSGRCDVNRHWWGEAVWKMLWLLDQEDTQRWCHSFLPSSCFECRSWSWDKHWWAAETKANRESMMEGKVGKREDHSTTLFVRWLSFRNY